MHPLVVFPLQFAPAFHHGGCAPPSLYQSFVPRNEDTVQSRAPGEGRVAGRQILRERNQAKLAPCGPFLYYLMKGLESLQAFACDGSAYLWRGVSRRVAP